jgi:hypothetical protein
MKAHSDDKIPDILWQILREIHNFIKKTFLNGQQSGSYSCCTFLNKL